MNSFENNNFQKKNSKERPEANQRRGQIRKESGNPAIIYITIIDFNTNVNPNKFILET